MSVILDRTRVTFPPANEILDHLLKDEFLKSPKLGETKIFEAVAKFFANKTLVVSGLKFGITIFLADFSGTNGLNDSVLELLAMNLFDVLKDGIPKSKPVDGSAS
jgi:hypothetical protein